MGGFNATEHEEQWDDTPLPEGSYYLQVEKAEIRETANKQGRGMNATFEVLGEVETNAHAGRKVFVWYNLKHSSEQAERIGNQQFAGLRKAVGVIAPQNTDELIGIPFIAKIGFDKKDKNKNVIKKYEPMEGQQAKPATPAAPTPPPAADAPAADAPATSKPKLPWEK